LLCYRVPRPMTTRMGNTADLTLLSFHFFIYRLFIFPLFIFIIYIINLL
jgi:hypothetical protein